MARDDAIDEGRAPKRAGSNHEPTTPTVEPFVPQDDKPGPVDVEAPRSTETDGRRNDLPDRGGQID